MGSQRVGHDWADTYIYIYIYSPYTYNSGSISPDNNSSYKLRPRGLQFPPCRVTCLHPSASHPCCLLVFSPFWEGSSLSRLIPLLGSACCASPFLLSPLSCILRASLLAQTVTNLPAMQDTWVWSLGWEDPLEEGMETHSSILAWRIPVDKRAWRLQSMGLTVFAFLLTHLPFVNKHASVSKSISMNIHGPMYSLHSSFICMSSKSPAVLRTFKIYSLSNFHIHNTILLAITIRPYNRSPELTHFRIEGLYPLTSGHVQLWELDRKEGKMPRIDASEL